MTEKEIERIARKLCLARSINPDDRVTLEVLERRSTLWGVVVVDGRHWQPLWTVVAHDLRVLDHIGALKELPEGE